MMANDPSIQSFGQVLLEFLHGAYLTLDLQRQLHGASYSQDRDSAVLANDRGVADRLRASQSELRRRMGQVLANSGNPPHLCDGALTLQWMHDVQRTVETLTSDLSVTKLEPSVQLRIRTVLSKLEDRVEEIRALSPIHAVRETRELMDPAEQTDSKQVDSIRTRERFEAIRCRVRELATKQPTVRRRLQIAFDEMVELHEVHERQRKDYEKRKLELACRALKSEPEKDHNRGWGRDWIPVEVQGLYPVALRGQLTRSSFDLLQPKEKRMVNQLALEAFKWQLAFTAAPARIQERMNRERLRACKSGSHVLDWWSVWIAPKSGLLEPVDPAELERSELLRFSVEQRNAIALYWLGALADDGWDFPLVAEPAEGESAGRKLAWAQRRWVQSNHGASMIGDGVVHLTLDRAESFLAQLEVMAGAEMSSAYVTTAEDHEKWLTSEQAASQYFVESSTLRRRAKREGWPTERTGRMLKFRRDTIERAGYVKRPQPKGRNPRRKF